jgi:hypothetical protein
MASILAFPGSAPAAELSAEGGAHRDVHRGMHLVSALQATAEAYAHTGNPLDIATQLCAVAAHFDLPRRLGQL